MTQKNEKQAEKPKAASKQVEKPKLTPKKVEKPKAASKQVEKPKLTPKKVEKPKAKEVLVQSFEVGQKVKTLDDNLEGEVLTVKIVEGILKKVKVKWENGMSYVVSPLSIKHS